MIEAHHSRYYIHSGSTKVYHDLKKNVLVGWHEEEHCGICGSMSKFSSSRAPKAQRLYEAYRTSDLEMGHDQHGFFHLFASFISEVWFYMDNSWQTPQISALIVGEELLIQPKSMQGCILKR